MIERKTKTLTTTYVLMDAVASALAMLAAYFLRFAVEVIPVTKGGQDLAVYAQIIPLVMLVFPIAFSIQGLYRIRPARTLGEETIAVTIASVVGIVLLSGILLWFRPGAGDPMYSRATLAIFVVCEILFVMSGRWIARAILRLRYRAGRNLERVLVAGSGELAEAVAYRIRDHRELGFDVVGSISEDGAPVDDLEPLGRFEEADQIVAKHQIDHVFVAVPHTATAAMMSLLDRLTRECASIHVVPDLLQFMALRSRVEDLDGLPTINLSETPLDGWNRIVKRVLDLTLASLALILFSPVMAIVALLVYLEDRGPVFYRQTRMGLDGVPFAMLKFRSMTPHAETESGAVWAHKDDPRRTKIGRWIRAWSLDELPQLWNVIRGEMSLVGPRPERPEFVEQFRTEYPHYMLRHKVRAGITGWAQVNGWRGNTSIRSRIEHDLYYIENWSLLLDLKILLMTVRHGFRNENAY
ncbi:MAG: undecaprenyl-phosphate glucose phosphotransferase [Thermoanaerobaculia bacterium]